MIRNLTVKELEAAVTQRVLLDRLIDKETKTYKVEFDYEEALNAAKFATNDMLLKYKLNRELWAKILNNRAFLFHCPTNRIVAEIGVITEDAGGGKRKRFRMELFGQKGSGLPNDIADVIISAAKLGKYTKPKRNKEK